MALFPRRSTKHIEPSLEIKIVPDCDLPGTGRGSLEEMVGESIRCPKFPDVSTATSISNAGPHSHESAATAGLAHVSQSDGLYARGLTEALRPFEDPMS
jgi:hypothetical protein